MILFVVCMTHGNIVVISNCEGGLISQKKRIKGGKIVMRGEKKRPVCGATPWNTSLPFLWELSGLVRSPLEVGVDFS